MLKEAAEAKLAAALARVRELEAELPNWTTAKNMAAASDRVLILEKDAARYRCLLRKAIEQRDAALARVKELEAKEASPVQIPISRELEDSWPG